MSKQIKYPRMIIGKKGGRYYRGAETVQHIFYCNYRETDVNAAVIMYRKMDFAKNEDWVFGYAGLECDNWHAAMHLQYLMLNGEPSFTYLSPTMREKVATLTEILILRALGEIP